MLASVVSVTCPSCYGPLLEAQSARAGGEMCRLARRQHAMKSASAWNLRALTPAWGPRAPDWGGQTSSRRTLRYGRTSLAPVWCFPPLAACSRQIQKPMARARGDDRPHHSDDHCTRRRQITTFSWPMRCHDDHPSALRAPQLHFGHGEADSVVTRSWYGLPHAHPARS